MSKPRWRRSIVPVLGAFAALSIGAFFFAGLISATFSGGITTVDSVGDVGSNTSMTVGTDGLPVISYYDHTNDSLKMAHCGDVGCISGNTLTTVDGPGVGAHTATGIGSDGLPVIAYLDIANQDLKVVHCGNAGCTSGNVITTVDSAGSVGLDTSIAIGADGLPIISYYNFAPNYDLKVTHCGNVECTAGNAITTVDSAGFVGAYTSIAIGSDSLPVIAYADGTNLDLKVAHCGNVSCTAGNVVTNVDGSDDVGVTTSVAIGTDGLPLVAYYDTTNSALKVVHCGALDCSSANTFSSLDTGGSNASVQIGLDGLPIISYTRLAFGELKVAHCGGIACAGGNTFVVIAVNYFPWNPLVIGSDGLPAIAYYEGHNNNLNVAHCAQSECSVPKAGTPTRTMAPTRTATPTVTPTSTPTRPPSLGGVAYYPSQARHDVALPYAAMVTGLGAALAISSAGWWLRRRRA